VMDPDIIELEASKIHSMSVRNTAEGGETDADDDTKGDSKTAAGAAVDMKTGALDSKDNSPEPSVNKSPSKSATPAGAAAASTAPNVPNKSATPAAAAASTAPIVPTTIVLSSPKARDDYNQDYADPVRLGPRPTAASTAAKLRLAGATSATVELSTIAAAVAAHAAGDGKATKKSNRNGDGGKKSDESKGKTGADDGDEDEVEAGEPSVSRSAKSSLARRPSIYDTVPVKLSEVQRGRTASTTDEAYRERDDRLQMAEQEARDQGKTLEHVQAKLHREGTRDASSTWKSLSHQYNCILM